MSTIAPTHTCFDDVLEYLEQLATAGAPARVIARFVVVHAICLAPDDQQYVHAWLECDGLVTQAGILNGERIYYTVPLEVLRDRVRVVEQTRYSVQQAMLENLRTGHYGPWVERYRALAGHGDAEPRVWDPQQPEFMALVEGINERNK
jgi:hypothetical protein